MSNSNSLSTTVKVDVFLDIPNIPAWIGSSSDLHDPDILQGCFAQALDIAPYFLAPQKYGAAYIGKWGVGFEPEKIGDPLIMSEFSMTEAFKPLGKREPCIQVPAVCNMQHSNLFCNMAQEQGMGAASMQFADNWVPQVTLAFWRIYWQMIVFLRQNPQYEVFADTPDEIICLMSHVKGSKPLN